LVKSAQQKPTYKNVAALEREPTEEKDEGQEDEIFSILSISDKRQKTETSEDEIFETGNSSRPFLTVQIETAKGLTDIRALGDTGSDFNII
jgi:hypothetical protein